MAFPQQETETSTTPHRLQIVVTENDVQVTGSFPAAASSPQPDTLHPPHSFSERIRDLTQRLRRSFDPDADPNATQAISTTDEMHRRRDSYLYHDGCTKPTDPEAHFQNPATTIIPTENPTTFLVLSPRPFEKAPIGVIRVIDGVTIYTVNGMSVDITDLSTETESRLRALIQSASEKRQHTHEMKDQAETVESSKEHEETKPERTSVDTSGDTQNEPVALILPYSMTTTGDVQDEIALVIPEIPQLYVPSVPSLILPEDTPTHILTNPDAGEKFESSLAGTLPRPDDIYTDDERYNGEWLK